jgi:hypothetical protein
MQCLLDAAERPLFAPPFLRHGDVMIGQTANTRLYLGPLLGLAPTGEANRLWAHQLQLTATDFVACVSASTCDPLHLREISVLRCRSALGPRADLQPARLCEGGAEWPSYSTATG